MKKESMIELIISAKGARENAYVPYSSFAVGAAVLSDDGNIFTGCNVENASYGATICAERTAIAKAISEGAQKLAAIAIVGGKQRELPSEYVYPCGICRQVIQEFASEDMVVIIAKNEEEYKTYSLEELFPYGFVL